MNPFGGSRIAAVMVALVALLTAADPASSQAGWTTKQPLPTPRHTLIAETIGGFIYAGQGNPSPAGPDTGRFDRYDPTADTWSSLCQPAPGGMLARGSAVLGGKLYAFGGESVLAIGVGANTDIFDPTSDPCAWTDGRDMPQPRIHVAAVAVNGLIFVLGGYSCEAGAGCESNEAYDPAADAWVVPAPKPMPGVRYVHSAAAVGGKIYVFGGRSSGDTSISRVDAYDPATDMWATLPDPMPHPRGRMAIAVMPGTCPDGTDQILLIGGRDEENLIIYGRVDGFCPSTGPNGTWYPNTIPDMPTARADLAAAVVGSTVYAIGGDNAGALDVVEAYRFNGRPVCDLAGAVPAVIWPPNHQFVPVSIVGITDPDNDTVAVTVTSVTQDEPVNGLGDGDTSPDAVIQGSTALVRAERAGGGNGRVYRIGFMADDGHGGTCTGAVAVSVPHSKKPGAGAVDDGQAYDSTQP